MQEYAYQALLASGNVGDGVMAAENEEELEGQLRVLGHYLIRAEPIQAQAQNPKKTDGRIPHKELVGFTEYLWASTQAGIPLLATLQDIALRFESKRLMKITSEIVDSVSEEGKSLADALAEHPRAFPSLYIGTIAAGEASGQLDYALGQLLDYLEWQQKINSHVRNASFYPAIVLAGMGFLIVVLLVFVYPKLLPLFASFNIELPLPTQAIMAMSSFLREKWHLLIMGIGGFVLFLQLVALNRKGREVVDLAKLHLPIVGPLIRSLEMARFVTYLGLFYRSGIPILKGLTLMEEILGNQVVRKAVRTAREDIAAGDTLANAFTYSRLFPPLVTRVLALGEATGNLDEALDRAKRYYDREIPAAVERMLAALQPLMVVLLGGLLLVITLSIFLPILRIYDSI